MLLLRPNPFYVAPLEFFFYLGVTPFLFSLIWNSNSFLFLRWKFVSNSIFGVFPLSLPPFGFLLPSYDFFYLLLCLVSKWTIRRSSLVLQHVPRRGLLSLRASPNMPLNVCSLSACLKIVWALYTTPASAPVFWYPRSF